MVKEKFRLPDAATYRRVKEWFDTGRGVYMWTNKDLSDMSRGEIITPGDASGAPHWAYAGDPTPLTPEDIEVEVRTPVDLPPEWYPECEHCKGRGHRTVHEIAEIRGVTDELAKDGLVRGGSAKWIDENTFECFSCRATGHDVSPPTFRVKRLPPYKGGGWQVSDAGKAACNDLCVKLANHYKLGEHNNAPKAVRGQLGSKFVKWDWRHLHDGLADAYFFTESVTPFTEFVES